MTEGSADTAHLFVLSGPSGVGKTTLAQAVIDSDTNLKRAITHTSRSRRNTEIDGVHYHFVTENQFLSMQENNEFLETVHIFGNYYGTSRRAVLERLNENVDTMLIIDWQGAQRVRESMNNVSSIFVVPPSLNALQDRLQDRADGNLEDNQTRLSKAKHEIQQYVDYDYVLINDFFDTTVENLHVVIDSVRTNQKVDINATPTQIESILAGQPT